LRPSAFIDIGSVFGVKKPNLENITARCTTATGTNDIRPGGSNLLECPGAFIVDDPLTTDVVEGPTASLTPGFQEFFLGNSPKPRLSIGVGVNWVSPFGPLRIDIAHALLKQEGDETKLFSFNVGTQF